MKEKSKMHVLLATKNVGKIKEMKEFLADLPVRLHGLNEFESIVEPEETGATFAENAILKAEYYAEKTEMWALADDSGLEIDALGGAPGVLSARYAGQNATYAEKMGKLLQELNETNAANRRARFFCSMAIADKTGDVKYLSEGVCNGEIAAAPSGANGFGYDPIFIPDGFSETFGELPNEIKQKISHRTRAIEKIIRFLRDNTAV